MAYKKRPVIVMVFLVTILCLVTSLPASMNMPLVDPGLFVISGVKTCGDTLGYCLLGNDCTTDDDFLPDPSGNCDGLKGAFTPSAPFTCCKFNKISPPQTTTPKKGINTIKKTSTETKDKLSRNTREDIDSSKMDIDQLSKLSQIESVIKKIVEQLINETANHIQIDETTTGNETVIDEDTIRNEIQSELPMINDTVEVNETTVEPPTEAYDETSDDEMTDNPSETKEETADSNNIYAIETEDQDSYIDDEFRAEKHICQKTCKSEIIFSVDKKPLCYGTLLDDIWILTSGTCASRLNKAGIRKVTVSRKDILGSVLNISNILVHENFKSPASKNTPDNNDLALTSLNEPLDDPECTPCFNQKRNITNEICKSFQNTNFKNSVKSTENCEGRVQLRNLISNPYLILPCNRWRMQYNREGRLGSGLWCDGKLAGVQTGVGVGSLIYTPVNEYAMWISDNKRIERRR